MPSIASGPRHAPLAAAVVNLFQRLDLGISLWDRGRWYELHELPQARSVLGFELEHGIEVERLSYNEHCLGEARRKRATVVAERGGFTDLFVPVECKGPIDIVIVAGPVATARPTATDVLSRWRALTGRQGHPFDPEFSHYVDATLGTLRLEGSRLSALREVVEKLARLMSGQGGADDVHGRIEALGRELLEARVAERMWEIARAMVDQRTSRWWASPVSATRLAALGVRSFPRQVVVGLIVNRDPRTDPTDEVIRRDALQHACVDLARRAGDVVSGKVGGHGVILLGAGRGKVEGVRQRLLGIAERAASIARRRFGLGLHLGVAPQPGPLPEQYEAALGAAESALARGTGLIVAETEARGASPLGSLRHDLVTLLDRDPGALSACFDRYLEAVAVRSGYRVDPARAHLEAAFQDVLDRARVTAALDPRSLSSLGVGVERAAAEAPTLTELFTVYQRAMKDVADAVAAPAAAVRDRSLRRAEEHMRRHYGERLSLTRVARVAGFAPSHFSMLFHKKHGTTFERYLVGLRIERAKQLLFGTDLPVERIAQLAGFSDGHYFGRAFRRVTGETPSGYRRRAGPR